ncbi:MAG: YkgJ family cysteine cluster protein [Actinomycetota bacterium]
MTQDPTRKTLPLVDWAAPGDAPLADLERQLERGSQFAQAALDQMGGRLAGAEGYLHELVDLLKTRGVLAATDLATEDQDHDDPEEPSRAPDAPARLSWPGIALRAEPEEPPPPVTVNCAERMHICHAVCCKLNFALTPREVEGGKIKWDLGFPYMIRHGSNGYCIHNDTTTGRCTSYADRPGVCHRYDCTNDRRIWKDFDNMVLNEEWIRTNLANQSRITIRAPLPLMEVKPGNGAGTKEGPGES